jgi:hypothetical protein
MTETPAYVADLKLPGRFEKLAEASRAMGCDLASIIQRVDPACTEVDTLLREVSSSGLGRLQILHGLSGSGKTTFLKGLPYFFANIAVVEIPKTHPIVDLADFISNDALNRSKHRLYVVQDRDNPRENDTDLREAFERLRALFRESDGQVVVVWPITDRPTAAHIAELAWTIGRDSLLGTRHRVFEFQGLPRDSYFAVADITARALCNGESLDGFGISRDTADDFARNSDTIGEFYSKLNAHSASRNADTLTFLKERVRPRVWVVVPGDDLKELDRTISNLTQGSRNRIDIDKIGEFLDDKRNESAYLSEWRERRADMAYLMRILDVRLFELPANAALAAVRCFAPEAQKAGLKKQTEKPETCTEVFRATRVGQALVSPNEPCTVRIRDTTDAMAKEFMVVQQLAAKGDTTLNRAVAEGLRVFLHDSESPSDITSEKQNLPGSQLRPDIQVPFNDGTIACLELTWRSTGKHLPERDGRKPQNTMTPGHIMKYLLEKVMEYVKDLEL